MRSRENVMDIVEARPQLTNKPDEMRGKVLFRDYCASCHHKDMRSLLVGPGLLKAMNRWNNDTLSIYEYIFNINVQQSKRS